MKRSTKGNLYVLLAISIIAASIAIAFYVPIKYVLIVVGIFIILNIIIRLLVMINPPENYKANEEPDQKNN
jgi:hypothetical protein